MCANGCMLYATDPSYTLKKNQFTHFPRSNKYSAYARETYVISILGIEIIIYLYSRKTRIITQHTFIHISI